MNVRSSAYIYMLAFTSLDASDITLNGNKQPIDVLKQGEQAASKSSESTGKCRGHESRMDRIPVPVNIADVRYGRAEKAAKTQPKAPIDLSAVDQHLPAANKT